MPRNQRSRRRRRQPPQQRQRQSSEKNWVPSRQMVIGGVVLMVILLALNVFLFVENQEIRGQIAEKDQKISQLETNLSVVENDFYQLKDDYDDVVAELNSSLVE